MPNPQKIQEVKQVRELVERAQAMVLTDYRGLTVAEISVLRTQLREKSSCLRVVKNRLMRRALTEAGATADVSEHLKGPTAIAFGFEDPVALAKILLAFGKDHQVFSVKAGILGDTVLDRAGVEQLSKMPGLAEVRAQLARSLKQPLSQVATIMQAKSKELATATQQMLSKMLYAFQARQQQLEG